MKYYNLIFNVYGNKINMLLSECSANGSDIEVSDRKNHVVKGVDYVAEDDKAIIYTECGNVYEFVKGDIKRVNDFEMEQGTEQASPMEILSAYNSLQSKMANDEFELRNQLLNFTTPLIIVDENDSQVEGTGEYYSYEEAISVTTEFVGVRPICKPHVL